MSNQQHAANLPIKNSAVFNTINLPEISHLQTDTGTLIGLTDDELKPLIIKLDNGRIFTCGGLNSYQLSAIHQANVTGQIIEFYHSGYRLSATPIAPKFKSVVVPGLNRRCVS